MPVQTQENPSPVAAGSAYTITVTGGTPPYEFRGRNMPPGAIVTALPPDQATVEVPANTPSGTKIQVQVTDAATGSVVSRNTVF